MRPISPSPATAANATAPRICPSASRPSPRCATKMSTNLPPSTPAPPWPCCPCNPSPIGSRHSIALCLISPLRDNRAMTSCNYNERFGGIERLYGREGAAIIRCLHVCVVGLGGVGSWAEAALARSGIGRLTLIEYDEGAEGNINRQLPALGDTIGRKKFAVLAERVTAINPDCVCTAIDDFVPLRNLDD